MTRRVASFGIALTVVVAGVGCAGSGSVRISGQELADPAAVLRDVRSRFTADVNGEIQAKTAGVAPGTACFFSRADDGNSDSAAYCGPIRRLGRSDAQVWQKYPLQLRVDRDGKATATVSGTPELSLEVDEKRLFNPDASPALVKDAAAPQAPQSSVRDKAIVVDADKQPGSFNFAALEKHPRLVTPSAVIEVTHFYRGELLPSLLGGEGERSAEYYRAGEGQEIVAYRLTQGPGPALPEPNQPDSARAKDASTSYSLAVAGQQLTIQNLSSTKGWGEHSAWTVSCPRWPCSSASPSTRSLVLLASVAKGSQPQFVGTVDGQAIKLDLGSGAVAADVSTVLMDRTVLSQQVSVTFPQRRLTQPSSWGEKSLTYGGAYEAVYLTGFDPLAGWASKGKAWLQVPAQRSYSASSNSWSMSLNTWTLHVGNEVLTALKDAGASGTMTFLVSSEFTVGKYTFQPQGTVTYSKGLSDEATASFKGEAASFDISIPR